MIFIFLLEVIRPKNIEKIKIPFEKNYWDVEIYINKLENDFVQASWLTL